ncbi:MAG TPA: lipocalin-like domain-containing protein [Chloroflexota bacterium]|nr:lipocalin-like domain-containing protein [Chloroflexota bacterium]
MRRLAIALAVLLSACARGAPIDPAVLAPPSAAASAPTQPDHVTLPQDDAPHADLTEWWYYTGHLEAAGGKTYGFELVIFQVLRRDDPPGYAAHFAVTDNNRGDFHFQERSETGKQVHASPGFDLDLSGWSMKGGNGHDHLKADLPDYAIDLDLTALKPAVLHEGKGLISFGPAGDSYYYSRTRLDVAGKITDRGQQLPVTGLAWMDHQWGNFISGIGGWDWFSIQLDDRSEYMLFFLRDANRQPTLSYGTYVAPDGSAAMLPPASFGQKATGSWLSPASGIVYPSGWEVAAGDATLTLTPTVKDQELRTGQSTGITYWEGDVRVSMTKGGQPVRGVGYVELVGYR